MARSRSYRGALACICVALGGCATLEQLMREEAVTATAALTFDREVDLLPPESLSVVSSADRTIVLTWSPVLVGEVAGYAIMRAPDAAGPFRLVGRTTSRFGTLFSDRGEEAGALGDGQTYFYRVHPYDLAGRVSRSHAALRAQTEPRPAPPGGLTIYSNLPRKVVLSWIASPRHTVTGYGVYRSPTQAGPWERVRLVEGRLNTIHEDPVEGDLRVMYYRLTAVNRFGGESDMTSANRAVTKADPLPPIGLHVAERHVGRVELGWSANVEDDLVAYEVWRVAQQDSGWPEPTRIAEVGPAPDALAWRDTGVGCGQRVRYRLRARDRDGLVSAFSAPLEVEGLDLDVIVGTAADGRPELRWSADRATGWARARIELDRGFGLPRRVLGWADPEPRFRLPADLEGDLELRIVLERPGQTGQPPDEAPACAVAVAIEDGELRPRAGSASAASASP